MNGVAIGIDFGTTKTLVVYPSQQGDKPEIAHLGRERNSLPTSAFFGESGTWEFGDDADDYACDEVLAERYVSKFKLKLGSRQPVLQVFNGDSFSSFTAREVTIEYLRYIRITCEKEIFNGHSVTEAVITHPIHFSPAQIEDLRYAAEQAGFSCVKLMREPEAAGTAFCRLCPKEVFNGTALVVDWGGGTLDLALVSREDGNIMIHDNYVAGTDTIGGVVFDELLWKYVANRIQQESGVSLAMDSKDFIRLQKKKICAAKEKLSRTERATLTLSGSLGAYPTMKMTREELEKTIQPCVQAGIESIRALLGRIREQTLRPSQVLLIGGSSQIPLISKLIEEATGLPCRRWQYSHEAVALGTIVADSKKEMHLPEAVEKDTPRAAVGEPSPADTTSAAPPKPTPPSPPKKEVPRKASETAKHRRPPLSADRGNIMAHLSAAALHDKTTAAHTRLSQGGMELADAEFVLKKADEVFSGGAEALSIPMYLKAAEMGSSHAQWKLALRYAMGRGIGKDLTEAEKWCQLAVQQGHSKAEYTLTQIRLILTNPHGELKRVSFIKHVKNEKSKITDERRCEEDEFLYHLDRYTNWPLAAWFFATIISLGVALLFIPISISRDKKHWRVLSKLAPSLSKDFIKSAYQEVHQNRLSPWWGVMLLVCTIYGIKAAIVQTIHNVVSGNRLTLLEQGIYPEWLSQLLALAK